MSAVRDEPLSAVDHAWLRMDRPTNLMMITSLIELEERVTRDAFEAVIRERLLNHPRFTQRIASGLGGRPRWSVDPSFDMAAHVHRVGLPPPGGAIALRALVGDLMSTPLDRARPLWQAHLVEEYGAGSAIVVRLHHCIADGIALVRLLLSMTDHEGPVDAPGVGLPPAPPTGLLGRARRAAATVASAVRLVSLPADPPSLLHGRLGVGKRAAWSAGAPLEAVRGSAHAVGGTVNDVLLAAIAGALRHYLGAHGGDGIVELRALVPVNLRQRVGGGEAGNRFGLVYVSLPLTSTTPDERLWEMRTRMAEVKASPDAQVSFGILGVLGLANVAVERFGIGLFTRKATVMVTSVPGPSAPVRLAGSTVHGLNVWAPASGGLGVTLTLLSYRGEVRLGVSADEHVVPDPQEIADAFDDELRVLTARAAS